ncbi:hypothetical protein PF023_07135, partial [Enterococcus thailandicus]|uniref:hypothetical protein n=1 Tax=Enterococcus thailandicus TaxID=417368 RepID=UPI0022EC0724
GAKRFAPQPYLRCSQSNSSKQFTTVQKYETLFFSVAHYFFEANRLVPQPLFTVFSKQLLRQ